MEFKYPSAYDIAPDLSKPTDFTPPSERKPKNSKKRWTISIGVIFVLAVAGVVTYVLLTTGDDDDPALPAQPTRQADTEINTHGHPGGYLNNPMGAGEGAGTTGSGGGGTDAGTQSGGHDVAHKMIRFIPTGRLPGPNGMMEDVTEKVNDGPYDYVSHMTWYDPYTMHGIYAIRSKRAYASRNGDGDVIGMVPESKLYINVFHAEGTMNEMQYKGDFMDFKLNGPLFQETGGYVRANEYGVMFCRGRTNLVCAAAVVQRATTFPVFVNAEDEFVKGKESTGDHSQLQGGSFSMVNESLVSMTPERNDYQNLLFKSVKLDVANKVGMQVLHGNPSTVKFDEHGDFRIRQSITIGDYAYCYISGEKGENGLFAFDLESGTEFNELVYEKVKTYVIQTPALSRNTSFDAFGIGGPDNSVMVYYDGTRGLQVWTGEPGKYDTQIDPIDMTPHWQGSFRAESFECMNFAGDILAVMGRNAVSPSEAFVAMYKWDKQLNKFDQTDVQVIKLSTFDRANRHTERIALTVRPEHHIATLIVPMPDGSIERFTWEYVSQ